MQGSVTVKVVPSPGRLVNSILPPCASTVRCAVESPSPVPCALVVKYGMKMRFWFSGAMPTPVSDTLTTTLPSRVSASRRKVPPSGIAWIALMIRLVNTRCRSDELARTAPMAGSSLTNRISGCLRQSGSVRSIA